MLPAGVYHGQAYQVRVVGADSPGAASPCSPGSRAMSEDPSSAESSFSNVRMSNREKTTVPMELMAF